MQRIRKPQWLWLVVVVAVIAGIALHTSTPATADPSLKGYAANIDSFILDQLATQPRTDVFVKMTANADLSAAAAITDRVQRLNTVHDTLTALAELASACALLEANDRWGLQGDTRRPQLLIVGNDDLDLAQEEHGHGVLPRDDLMRQVPRS